MPNHTSRRSLLAAASVAVTAAAVSPRASAATAPSRPAPDAGPAEVTPAVEFRAWTTAADWGAGAAQGTAVEDLPGGSGDGPQGLRIETAAGTVDLTDPHTGATASWEWASWTSPAQPLAVPAAQAVVSWNAHTPAGTWLAVELRGSYTDGTSTPWYVMGHWAAGDQDIRRTSVDAQQDGRSSIRTDTFAIDTPASGLRLAGCELRLTLYRTPGTALTPTVRRLGLLASDLPERTEVPPAAPGLPAARELPVPRYSQEIHRSQYPQYDSGGEAWCSPTSSQMVIAYWGQAPTPADLAWVSPDYADPQVCQAARGTYDYQYQGCGNWPFNAAYAATYPGLQAVVTRLRSLTDAEQLIQAGIPVITSVSFRSGELDGAGYDTAGHLMVLVGFTAQGDVIANDPASPSDDAVRRVYQRRQFENVWLRTKWTNAAGTVADGSGGICYLYFPTDPDPTQTQALASCGVR
ncbi:C39 family peptidase [Kitasatospora sp. NBC_01250]|uniref:C39 family peptidase n=1 Tax=Kitasatospora sp. NBC_01250 TaxID=2903571 RepID=UPI002E2F5588|nr:C39 family peptidase [Kitasatospora sp. NBC_01250]